MYFPREMNYVLCVCKQTKCRGTAIITHTKLTQKRKRSTKSRLKGLRRHTTGPVTLKECKSVSKIRVLSHHKSKKKDMNNYVCRRGEM